ncbi:MAG: hypothetical protein K5864_03575 [Bacteroidales bacterium]|nr:hypothetical protein [Bacteroidales bacterium]
MKQIKRVLLLSFYFTFYLCNNSAFGQFVVLEDSVVIQDIIHVCPTMFIVEELSDGPTIYGYYKIENNSSDTIDLDLTKMELSYIFYLAGHNRDALAVTSKDSFIISIAPGKSYRISVQSSLFIHPPIKTILNYYVVDFTPYIEELVTTLTFRLKYDDKIYSIPVKNIAISKNYVIDYSDHCPVDE